MYYYNVLKLLLQHVTNAQYVINSPYLNKPLLWSQTIQQDWKGIPHSGVHVSSHMCSLRLCRPHWPWC